MKGIWKEWEELMTLCKLVYYLLNLMKYDQIN